MREFFSKNFVTRILPIIIVVVSLVPMIVYFAKGSSYDKMYLENEQKIDELTAELEGLQRSATADEASPDSMKTDLNSAASLGIKVADLQNAYRKIMNNADDKQKEDGLINNANALRECFKDGLDAQAVWCPSKKQYVWSFKTTYSIAESQIPCLFLCYADETDPSTLLMYVKATYDADVNKFVSFKKKQTSVGDDYFNEFTDES